MNLVELKDLPCDAVAAQHDVVALGEGKVGHAAETEADGAVDCGAGVLAQVLPQALLLLLGLGAAVQQQEDVADRHHHREVVEHIGCYRSGTAFDGFTLFAVG